MPWTKPPCRPTVRTGLAAALCLLASLGSHQGVWAQNLGGENLGSQTQPSSPTAPAIDPAQAAAKTAFEQLPDAARRALQDDLIWTGDFNGVAGGEFGRRTYDALLAFERRQRLTADGVLTGPERATLKQAADAARAQVRFAAVTDPATGIRIGLPQAVLTQRVAVQNGVVHRRADGQMSVQLTRFPEGEGLASLFERLRADAPGRKVTYRLQRPDWFVISGEEGGRRFYTRVAEGPGGLRGYTFRFPLAEASSGDRLMVAIANSFEPFPGTDAAVNPARQPAQPAQPVATPTPPGLAPAVQAHAITATRIAPTTLVTSAAALKSCVEPRLAGRPIDPALIRTIGEVATIEGVPAGAYLALAPSASASSLFALSFEDGAARSVALSPASLREGFAQAGVQAAAGGAPIIDEAGRLVAMVRDAPDRVRLVAGVAPARQHRVVMLEGLPASPPGAVASPAAAAAAIVGIRCARRL
jgi:hypothetical protein